jgi:AraC-like DNA-binding protein
LEKQVWPVEVVPISSPDDLREISRGSDLDIVQLKPGKLQGSIKHFAIGSLGISMGDFNSGVRVRGALDQERLVLGTILDSAGRTTQWWKDIVPGDIGIFPARTEIDVIHGGGAAYLLVSIGLPELASMLATEEELADPAFWNAKRVCYTNPLIGAEILQRLMRTIASVEHTFSPSDQVADFLERSIIESFVVGVMSASKQPSTRSHTGARLVSEAEDYVDAADGRPVHISELCSALNVSRRSLHRAFSDALGIGPVAYLRSRRLSAIQSALKRCDPATVSIGELAFEYGFPEPGRFAAYYRAHFGETPSETVRSRQMGKHSLR